MTYGILIGFGLGYNVAADYLLTFAMTLFMFITAARSISQPEIHLSIVDLNETVKYARSSLNDEAAQRIQGRLLDLMEQNKPYLNKNLRLEELAGFLNVPVHHLSRVINEKTGLSFF